MLDIETVSETGDPKGALTPEDGRIACIGLLIDALMDAGFGKREAK